MQKAYSRINWQNEPSTETALGANNLNKVDKALDTIDDRVLSLYGYESRAAESEKNAKESAVNAKTSEENAKESELLAKEYADRAFVALPENYEEIVDKVEKMDIKETASTTLLDSKDGGYKLLSMSGNSVQNGTPTLDAPQSIHNVGDCVEMMQGYYGVNNGNYTSHATTVCNKNKIPCASGDAIKVAYETSATTIALIYYNDNGYLLGKFGSNTNAFEYVAPSGATYFNFYIDNGVESATVGKISLTINGKYVVQIATNYGVEMMQGGWNATAGHLPNIATCVCNKTQVSCKTGDVVNIKCAKASGINLLLYNENTFVSTLPMSTSGVTIPSGVTNFKFNINSTSDITPDTVGKITITINGVGEKVATVLLNAPLRDTDVMSRTEVARKRAKSVFVGADSEAVGVNASGKLYFVISKIDNTTPNILCNRLQASDITVWNGNVITNITDFTTVDEAKTWLSSNSIEFEYNLATPTTETLDTDSQIALNSLETFDGVTYINVDSRVQPSEIKGEYGTSKVGARTLKNELRNDTLEIKYNELAVALVATESGV